MSKDKTINTDKSYRDMFAGVIGRQYELLNKICPLATEMSRLVGEQVKYYAGTKQHGLNVLELGGGTGITTLSILLADDDLSVLTVDNEPAMQQQAKESLLKWSTAGRLQFSATDALTALQGLETDSFDLMASAYTLHNFEHSYRKQVYQQIYRVLKPGGQFINGDRYALDDISAHTHQTQLEIADYFRVLKELNKLDVLEHWIIHLFNDESENHIMRESLAIAQLEQAGFSNIKLTDRQQVNALLIADKVMEIN